MKDIIDPKSMTRRGFISGLAPACALTCLGVNTVMAWNPGQEDPAQETSGHKFDQELPGPKITYRRFAAARHRSFIRFARFLQTELGEEKVIELIKKETEQRLNAQAKRDLERLGKSDFKSYISIFRDPRMLSSLNMEIVEDTDTAFEIRVTDCLAAESFLPHKAGDIGYAAVCWGDYNWASDFNPKIKLVRDKTLMQGHDCCNHRYIWTG
jgi:hypothetical protein